MTALLLRPQPAHAQGPPAGFYSGPAYSGGTYTNPNNRAGNPPLPPVNDGPTGTNNSQWGGGTGCGFGYNASNTPQSFSGSSACTGDITATFTWTPINNSTAPPPPVIVTETTSAGWAADDASGTGDYQSPHPFPEVPASSGYGKSQTGTWYSMKAGASSVTTTGSMSSSASGTGSSSAPGTHSASCFVVYGASVSPVTISLGGTLTDSSGNPVLDSSGNQQILVGQRCTASINGISVPGATVSYAWTVAGNRVANYVVSADQTTGTPTPFTSPNANSAYWYWSDKSGAEAVSCTATITPATGQGAQFSVTATKTVQLQAPPVNVNIVPGAVQLNGTNSGTFGTPYALYLGSPDTNTGQGITWTGQVNQLSAFSSQGAGNWQFTQLITPTRSRTISKGTPQKSSNDGKSGLDKFNPYGNVIYSADNSKHSNGDSSGFGLQDTCSNYTVNEAFQTYVMYKPPTASGSDSILVPLYEIDWNWGANVNIVDGSWANFGSNSVGGTLTITSKQAQTQHPSWNMLIKSPPVW